MLQEQPERWRAHDKEALLRRNTEREEALLCQDHSQSRITSSADALTDKKHACLVDEFYLSSASPYIG
jgi:hypothetical protein